MKKILNIFAFVAVFATMGWTAAAVPSAINYQGRLTDAAGVPQPGMRTMTLKLYDSATDGALLFSQSIGNVLIDANGVYSFQFGDAGMKDVLAVGAEQWLELAVDNIPQRPRQRLLAVPFALTAASLPEGAVTSAMIANGAVGSAQLSPGAAVENLNIRGPFDDRAAAIAHGVSEGSFYFKPDGSIWRAALLPPLATFCAVGDSITDRMTFRMPIDYDSIGSNTSGWGAILEQLSGRKIAAVGPTDANLHKVGPLKDRDHGYSGITAYYYMNGSQFMPPGFRPIDDAIASDPDVFIVHIGTNDIGDQTVETIVGRVRAVWAALIASGKPVIGTDILQRAAYHNSPSVRDKIIAVNSTLRSHWKNDGLVSYRQWDDLLDKDPLSGYATETEFPGSVDGIHPSMRVAVKLAKDLHAFLASYYAGVPPTIPTAESLDWITSNSKVAGGNSTATGWVPQFLGTAGEDVTFSKLTDPEGEWQRVEIINGNSWSGNKGVYTRQTGLGTAFNVGDRCIATARIRVPEGTNLNGIGFSIQCVGASVPWVYSVTSPGTSYPSPIGSYDVTIYSDPFTIPPGTSEIWFLINPSSGSGIFDFQRAGIFKIN